MPEAARGSAFHKDITRARMKPLLLLLSCLLFSWQAFAQEILVQGKVTDKNNGEALIGVTIRLDDSGGTTTDVDGKYELRAMPGVHKLVFSFVGFEPEVRSIEVAAGGEKVLNVKLSALVRQLEMIVVSAGKFEQKLEEVTVSMESIEPRLIESKNTWDMENFMGQVPGVTMLDGQASIRGGSGFVYGAGSRVLVLVDDMPMLAADANDVKWNYLPIENMERMEVIKGASSALYGSSALNGVINVRTAYPKSKPSTKINFFSGMYSDPVRPDSTGSRRNGNGSLYKPLKWWEKYNPMVTGINFNHSRQVGNLDLVVGGNAYGDSGYREGESEQVARLNFNLRYRSKKVKGLSYGINGNGQRNAGGLFLLWADADSGAYRPQGGLDPATTTMTFFNAYRTNFDPYIQYVSPNGVKHTLRTRYFFTYNEASAGQSSRAHLIFGEYQFQRKFANNLTVTAGLTSTSNAVISDLFGDRTGINVAGYAQLDKRWDRLGVSVGLRGEYFKIDTAQTATDITLGTAFTTDQKGGLQLVKNSPIKPVTRVGANYRIHKATYLRASYGEGYRFPAIAEKFVSTSVGPLKVFPNPDLQAETGISAEIGVKQGFTIGSWKGFADVAAFRTLYNDMMEFTFGFWNPDTVPISLDWLGFKSLNAGKARINGLEFGLLTEGSILGLKTRFYGGYTEMDPVNFNRDSIYLLTRSDTTSDMLKYRYRRIIKADVQFEKGRWMLGFSGRYNSFMENVDQIFEAELVLPGVHEYRERNNNGDWVFDARMSAKISEESTIALIMSNVLNHEYMGRPGDIKPPRFTSIRYSVRF